MTRTFATKTIDVLSKITCDCCGIGFGHDTGEEAIEAQEFISIDHLCGYASVFGDMKSLKLDMCQYCFKKILGQYVKISEYDN